MRKKIKNRSITKARFLYLYFVISGVLMFIYAIASVVTGYFTDINLPLWYTPLPIALLLVWFIGIFVVKNHKMFWLYIKDTEQGRLMLHLTDSTHFSQMHKDKIVKWVYLPKKSVRNQTWLRLSEKIRDGQELTKEEKKLYKYKVRILPQQATDGINKAILINSLIWAHKNIHVLDDELRDILELTDDNMAKFDIKREIDRCKKKEYQENYDKLMKIGMDAIKKEKQCQN